MELQQVVLLVLRIVITFLEAQDILEVVHYGEEEQFSLK
jgi:hypothetical protein